MRLIARPIALGLGSLLVFAALLLVPPLRAAAAPTSPAHGTFVQLEGSHSGLVRQS